MQGYSNLARTGRVNLNDHQANHAHLKGHMVTKNFSENHWKFQSRTTANFNRELNSYMLKQRKRAFLGSLITRYVEIPGQSNFS